MTITKEIRLKDFEFWSGGSDTAENLTYDELDEIEAYLEDTYPDGMSEIEVNDFMWYERDLIADLLGSNYDELVERWVS